MSKDPRDAVQQITKGKRSGLQIGSRAIPHRLTQEERKLFDSALEDGVLRTLPKCRDNLPNAFFLHCEALELPFIHCDCRKDPWRLELVFFKEPSAPALALLKEELIFTSGELEQLKKVNKFTRNVDAQQYEALTRGLENIKNETCLQG